MITYHLTPKEEFDENTNFYTPKAYEKEGFIHTTKTITILHDVGNRYYQKDTRDYIVLIVELDKVASPWRYDAAGEDYPHIYGPIPKEAILSIQNVKRSTDGTFLPMNGDATK